MLFLLVNWNFMLATSLAFVVSTIFLFCFGCLFFGWKITVYANITLPETFEPRTWTWMIGRPSGFLLGRPITMIVLGRVSFCFKMGLKPPPAFPHFLPEKFEAPKKLTPETHTHRSTVCTKLKFHWSLGNLRKPRIQQNCDTGITVLCGKETGSWMSL